MTARGIAETAMAGYREIAEAGLVQSTYWMVFACQFR